MDDVIVIEAAHNLDDGIDLPNGGEEFVAEAGTLGGSFDEAGDINEFDRCRDDFLGLADFSQHLKPIVRNRDHTDIGVDGAKRVVRSLRITGARDCVEEC